MLHVYLLGLPGERFRLPHRGGRARPEGDLVGTYAIIRHPMYAGLIPMYLAVPLMLGSFVALFIFLPVIPVMVLRIFDEEKLLLRDLPGYREYTQKVRYRLIPGVW